MPPALHGRTALVTGGALRIGRRIVERLVQEGCDVVIHAHRSRDEARALAQEMEGQGVRAWTVHADLGDPEAATAMVEEAAREAGGPLDLLVNNASGYPRVDLEGLSHEDLVRDLTVNAWSPFAALRAFAAQAPPGAAAVNLLDTRIVDYDERHVAYILAKKTLHELTRMTALAYAPDVRVNSVAPGPILPPVDGVGDVERMGQQVPLRRVGDPDWVADGVLFLLAAPYTTGQVLFVDGGRHLGRRL